MARPAAKDLTDSLQQQAAGRLDLLGPASDVYSLGVIFFELLTGRVPVEASKLTQVREAVVSQTPLRSVRDLRPDLPVEAEQLGYQRVHPAWFDTGVLYRPPTTEGERQ